MNNKRKCSICESVFNRSLRKPKIVVSEEICYRKSVSVGQGGGSSSCCEAPPHCCDPLRPLSSCFVHLGAIKRFGFRLWFVFFPGFMSVTRRPALCQRIGFLAPLKDRAPKFSSSPSPDFFEGDHGLSPKDFFGEIFPSKADFLKESLSKAGLRDAVPCSLGLLFF